ncbi:hypothetical protein T440DRAFT_491928 [Plenodomus tracheiphilus IPT5]|uniref:N-acetyltransferase domain-containing protein n=1 Tax=Plenodomus tracheiphilus IPT5 TaxID=1408161 RepID=A0A6A7AW34_9PLEO|nr:hypothetical protein T440DRAFT_491928 [Plenodomus tracheiphilus IPT5]
MQATCNSALYAKDYSHSLVPVTLIKYSLPALRKVILNFTTMPAELHTSVMMLEGHPLQKLMEVPINSIEIPSQDHVLLLSPVLTYPRASTLSQAELDRISGINSKSTMDKKVWEWERTVGARNFVISSDHTVLPRSFVQEAFATEAMFWAKPVSPTALETMLSNSLTLGLYAVTDGGEAKTPIGMARLITDYTTFAYLTDVYLQAAYRSLGLGKWLFHCCREATLEMPDLRFMQLLTGSEQAQQLYRRELGMQKIDGNEEALVCMGARKARLAEAAESCGPRQQRK